MLAAALDAEICTTNEKKCPDQHLHPEIISHHASAVTAIAMTILMRKLASPANIWRSRWIRRKGFNIILESVPGHLQSLASIPKAQI
jgi:hypothetical protein